MDVVGNKLEAYVRAESEDRGSHGLMNVSWSIKFYGYEHGKGSWSKFVSALEAASKMAKSRGEEATRSKQSTKTKI